ncbi:MAG: DUF362 domain-containing protein [Dehalococcoidia bacterium]|nr:DUF362 domain-containing protein [Dehalococcoidia bacterium]
MRFDASRFVFEAPPVVSRARRILIKPCANIRESYPATTSREMIHSIIRGIRKVSDADIIILDGSPDGEPMMPIYRALGYDFPRVLMLDVKDCVWVEVDNPLPKPLIVPTFWIPNVILSSDYLITVSPLKVVNGQGWLSIMNLLSLLPVDKYGDSGGGWQDLYALGIDKVIADLYFTLPFDIGIIEGRQKMAPTNSGERKMEEVGNVFTGDPFQVDREVSESMGIRTDYLDLIRLAESGLDTM